MSVSLRLSKKLSKFKGREILYAVEDILDFSMNRNRNVLTNFFFIKRCGESVGACNFFINLIKYVFLIKLIINFLFVF